MIWSAGQLVPPSKQEGYVGVEAEANKESDWNKSVRREDSGRRAMLTVLLKFALSCPQ